MKRLDFLGLTFGSILALLAPKKAEATSPPYFVHTQEKTVEELQAQFAKPTTYGPEVEAIPIDSLSYTSPRSEFATSSIVCKNTFLASLGSTHVDYFWVGDNQGFVIIEDEFIADKSFLLPDCLIQVPTARCGCRTFILESARPYALATPDERLVVFPRGDRPEMTVYYLGTWIYEENTPPRWAAP